VTIATESVPLPSRVLSSVNPYFTDNGRRARYGAAYLHGICAQAGVEFGETTIDSDTLAVDGTIEFARIGARVQLKCTSSFKVGNGNATLTLEDTWRRKWAENYGPIFVVIVKVPSDIPDWIEHAASLTRHRATAFGQRFDPAVHTKSMTFTAAHRLTVETIYDWRDQTYAFFDGRGGGA
jgi:hypothetical protein